MIIGQPQEFAIEHTICYSDMRVRLGDFFIWAHGNQIGDRDGAFDLDFIIDGLCYPILMQNFDNWKLDDLDTDALIVYLTGVLDSGSPLFNDRIGERRPVRHMIISAYNSEGFDEYFLSVIIAKDRYCRVIWKERSDTHGHEIRIPIELYQSVIISTYEQICSQTGRGSPMLTWLKMKEMEKERVRLNVLAQQPRLSNINKKLDLEIECIRNVYRQVQ
ncbi:MAG: hypothetical protein JNJ77_16735 [Planctomycetia bacterium]|nr:hypothetical protein [Planctomycetia bacterium]